MTVRSIKHRVRSREEQRATNLALGMDEIETCVPACLHIPGCRKLAVRSINWLADRGGPNVTAFPLLKTREPMIYRDMDRACHRRRLHGSIAAPVIDLPVPIVTLDPAEAPQQTRAAI